jgi:tetratricopeptide (TPR) repeat protein
LSEEVLRLRKAKLGPDHPDTLHSMWAVAAGYWLNGQIDEAIALNEETLKLRKAKLGPDHYWTLQSISGLAWQYQSADRLDEAILLSEEALELYKAKLGPDHPETLAVRDNRDMILGRKWLRQKEYTKAEPLLRHDLSRRGQATNWFRFHSESLLGASLLGQKKFGDAEPFLIQGYEGLKQREAKTPAPLRHHLTEAGERVVRLYEAMGRTETADEWRRKLPAPPSAKAVDR